MKESDIKPPMTVYEVGSYKMGNTNMRSVGVWSVRIESFDPMTRRVFASWNNNAQRWYSEYDWRAWRINRPVLVKIGLGRHRLQTREEKKASKGTP